MTPQTKDNERIVDDDMIWETVSCNAESITLDDHLMRVMVDGMYYDQNTLGENK